jgi:hypothetical protein
MADESVRDKLENILDELYDFCDENGINYLETCIFHEEGKEWASSFGRIGRDYDEILDFMKDMG